MLWNFNISLYVHCRQAYKHFLNLSPRPSFAKSRARQKVTRQKPFNDACDSLRRGCGDRHVTCETTRLAFTRFRRFGLFAELGRPAGRGRVAQARGRSPAAAGEATSSRPPPRPFVHNSCNDGRTRDSSPRHFRQIPDDIFQIIKRARSQRLSVYWKKSTPIFASVFDAFSCAFWNMVFIKLWMKVWNDFYCDYFLSGQRKIVTFDTRKAHFGFWFSA